MSQENVNLVRQIYEAVSRRDDVFPFRVYAENIVWDMSQVRQSRLLTRPVFYGHEGVQQFWREMVTGFGIWDLDVEEIIDAGDRVLAVVRDRVIGRASGAPAESGHVAVWTLSNGKVIRLQTFEDRRDALEAAGLSE